MTFEEANNIILKARQEAQAKIKVNPTVLVVPSAESREALESFSKRRTCNGCEHLDVCSLKNVINCYFYKGKEECIREQENTKV